MKSKATGQCPDLCPEIIGTFESLSATWVIGTPTQVQRQRTTNNKPPLNTNNSLRLTSGVLIVNHTASP
eukprot:scaffold6479_cov187-Skeletonema_marinoi.AAC.4